MPLLMATSALRQGGKMLQLSSMMLPTPSQYHVTANANHGYINLQCS